ncbi:transporter substrate-binding domain-containing protein [Paraburkholderia sp. UYCP14C]|uniref:transporter substrate-binding domain-containing protein n=1 Tax=Paraburkholderia sp. UYCP14C TaxID=2511130 RepID=UPI0010206991|nr:transporter substrate-binding domain-containing protein [Paraburkholderia sp. UYCP14C]RZF23930.1 transporter substrate-binding domain-containing protein [Paraburkholderia sp. UYCP14C]
MNYASRAFVVAAVTLASTFLLAHSASAQQRLVVGFDGSYPPYASIDKAGQLQGFEVDVANAVCAELKAKCEFKNIPWDGIFAALDASKIDVVAAGLNITEERKKRYLMTESYLKTPFAFMTTKDSKIDGTAATLNGQQVGTVGPGTLENYMRQKWRTVDLRIYDSMDGAVLDLDAGRIAAVFGEQSQLQAAYLRAKPGVYKVAGAPFQDPALGGNKGMAVRKDEAALLDRLNQATAKIVSSGKQAELSKKWFGIVLPAN